MYAWPSIGAKGKAAIPTLIDLLSGQGPQRGDDGLSGAGLMEEPGAAVEQAITNLAHSDKVSEAVRKYAEKILESLAKPKAK